MRYRLFFLPLGMDSRKPYILLAEDDEDDQELLREVLAAELPEVDLLIVSDGSDVVEYLKNCHKDELPLLILLDFNMPRMGAESTLKFLCGDFRYDTLPKMVWSTSNRAEDVHVSTRWGATHYFIKPYSMDGYSQIVKRILDTARFHLSMRP